MSKREKEVIRLKGSRRATRRDLLEFLRKKERCFFTPETDQKIFEILKKSTQKELVKSARSIFNALIKSNQGIVFECGILVAQIIFNPWSPEKKNWQPLLVKVFMLKEEVFDASWNTLQVISGIVDSELLNFIILQELNVILESCNVFFPEQLPFQAAVTRAGGCLCFNDENEVKMILRPIFNKDTQSLRFVIGPPVSEYLSEGKFTGEIYNKRESSQDAFGEFRLKYYIRDRKSPSIIIAPIHELRIYGCNM